MLTSPKVFFIVATFLLIHYIFINCSNNSKKEPASTKPDSLHSEQLLTTAYSIDSTQYKKGKTIFIADCKVCHGGKDRTDNYLEGVVERIGVNYLKLYLTKQDSLITAKNKYALRLKDTFGNLANSHNFKYSDEQLNAIIEYLK